MGLPLAQVALHFGANDVQGTVVREEIFQAAGATAGTEQKLEELRASSVTRVACPSSATRSTTSCGGSMRDPARAHLVREHGAGLLPAGGRDRGDRGRADRAQREAARRRARRRADLVHRVRPERRPAAAPAAALRLVRGRSGLDPARLAASSRAGAHRRGDARERDLGGADEGAAARRRAAAAGSGGGREAPHRRRGAPQRVRGPDAAPRPGTAVARADGAADGVRGLGGPRAGGRRREGARGGARRVRAPGEGRARGARARGIGALRLPAGLPRAVLREAALSLRSPRAGRPLHVPRARPRRGRAGRGARASLRSRGGAA